jgi:hypothetical protein
LSISGWRDRDGLRQRALDLAGDHVLETEQVAHRTGRFEAGDRLLLICIEHLAGDAEIAFDGW